MADLKAGCVFFHRSYVFPNGSQKDKFLVLLNNPRKNEPYLYCLTTSQEKYFRKRAPTGCQQSGKYYFIPANRTFFPKDTWLVISDIKEYYKTELLQQHFNGFLDIKGCLDENYIRYIITCMKYEGNLDVSVEHVTMIEDTYHTKKSELVKKKNSLN